jgi:uncharacterized protein YprB with RNaseH-like and TPR domain
MLEKFFKWEFRDKFRSVNLMKVFKDHIKTGSFKLRDLEHKFGIRRQVMKHTTSIFQIWRDWRNPSKKKAVLLCNKEDAVRLVRLTLKIFKKFKIKDKYKGFPVSSFSLKCLHFHNNP